MLAPQNQRLVIAKTITPITVRWKLCNKAAFAKFLYKPKVLDDIIAVARNVHAKFEASLRRIQELEGLPTSSHQQAALLVEQGQLLAPATIRALTSGGVLPDLRGERTNCCRGKEL